MFSIIIPAYNEGSKIAVTIFDIQKVLTLNDLKGAEIIVVDDGSTDRTAEMSAKAGTLTISHPCNTGYGHSVKDGIRAAANDTILLINADGSYPPEMIPVLVKEYEKGFDMIVGEREVERIKEPFKKRLLRSILRRLVKIASGKNIPDVNSGLRVFSKKEIMPLLPRLSNTFGFNSSMTLSYVMEDKFTGYIPVGFKSNQEKTKNKTGVRFFKTIQLMIGEILYYNPFKVFVMFCIGLLLLMGFNFLLTLVTGWLLFSYIGLGCILFSILFFGLGLFSLQLKSIISSK